MREASRPAAGAIAPIVFTVVAVAVATILGAGGVHPTDASLASATPAAGGERVALGLGPSSPASHAVAGDRILVGAGDISRCRPTTDDATAKVIESIIRSAPTARVFTAGDNAYEDGSARQFAECYDPTWGRFKNRTHPAIGNHDYGTPGAAGYFGYFGAAAGRRGDGWYSFNVGSWHVVVLNSNCEFVGCARGSRQETWLRADLLRSNATCTMAIWHHPRWSSSRHGSMPQTDAFYRDLFADGAELLIVGHGHEYERFAPQDPNERVNTRIGIREIMVGTGGTGLRPFAAIAPNSVVRDATTYGVLKLTLGRASYDWEFVPAEGTFRDKGTGTCH